MDFEPQIGSIIEFDAGDEHRLAIIVDTIGAKKLSILTADGDRMRTTPEDITFSLGTGSVQDLERAQQKLQELGQTIANRQSDIDLEILWEFVDGEDALADDFLADLMLSDSSAPTRLALRRAVRHNPVYFKHRRDDLFDPRDQKQVDSLRQQREARLQKERTHQRIIDRLSQALSQERDQAASTLDEWMGDDDALRNAVYLLQDFAAHGQDFHRRDEAEVILNDLIDHSGQHFSGHPDQKAFFLMEALGLWEEHENLALHRYRISRDFDDDLVEEAKTLADKPLDFEDFRRDMRDWTTVTIDAPSTRDLDDGLSCRPTIDGGFELAIHIADPSFFIDADNRLDDEARSRGTSLYLPSGTIPMFPPALSEEAMSLVAGEVRPAISTLVTFDSSLEVTDTEVVASIVEVDRRMSYDEVDEMLQSDDQGRFPGLVERLSYIASEVHAQRTDGAGAYFDLPDTEIDVDLDVDPPQVTLGASKGDTPANSLVSELMILNNNLVGRFCQRHQLPAIYRVQEPPEQDLEDDEILSIPEGVARTFAQIRRMNPGEITTQPSLHFGLGLHTYAQASSPIRRYADLLCQRQIKSFLSGQSPAYDQETMLELLGDVDRATSNAYRAMSATDRYWLIYGLAQIEEPIDATVVEYYDDRGGRAAVFLNNCAYKSSCTLRSQVPVGEDLEVVVADADPRLDKLSLRQAPED